MAGDPKGTAFDICFERILAGDSLEQVLQAYPQWAAEFSPLLEAAQAARLLRASRAPAEAQERSRERLLNEVRNLTIPHRDLTPDGVIPGVEFPVSSQRSRRPPAPPALPRRERKPAFKLPLLPEFFSLPAVRYGLLALLVIAFLAVGSFSTVAVSAQALPGDALYPIKLFTEQTQLLLTRDPARRLELEQNFDQKRAQEVNDLILRERSTTVNFAGGLQSVGPDEWLVEDIRVIIAPGTHISGDPFPGYTVNVQGTLLADGTVLATRIWTREFEVKGELHAVFPGRWQVDGLSILVDAQILAGGLPPIGSQLAVQVVHLASGELQARSVVVIALPPATAAFTSTDSPQPSDTAEFRPSRTPRPTEKPGDTEEETPEVEDTQEPSVTPDPDPTHDDDEHETPRPSKTPKPTDDDDDEEEHTPQPSQTPSPTTHADPTPDPTHDD